MRVYLSIFKFLASVACILCFAGCAAPPSPQVTEEVDLSAEAVKKAPQRERVVSGSAGASVPVSAIHALLRDANYAIEQQQYARASSLAERALRMQPKNGEPYFVLAKTYYFQQQLALARSFLARARSLAAGNAGLIESIAQFSQQHKDL